MSEPNRLARPGPLTFSETEEKERSNARMPKSFKMLRPLTDYFKVKEVLGSGSFGVVHRCVAMNSKKPMAVKIFKNSGTRSAAKKKAKNNLWLKTQKEYEICHLLKQSTNIVQIVGLFLHRALPCLVFELLDECLLDVIENGGPMPMKTVRPLARQLLQALSVLKEKDLIHGDLKPENIMLKHSGYGLQLKVIDFGGCMYLSEDIQHLMFQTLHFRAPEVLICAPRSVKVDMWSAGCIVAEMLAGRRLYPGNTLQEQLYIIDKCQGPIPEHILMRGLNTFRFYRRSSDELEMNPEEYYKILNLQMLEPYYTFQTNSLYEVTGFDKTASMEDKLKVVSLLQLMLHLDEVWRCFPEEGLLHEFFNMDENSSG